MSEENNDLMQRLVDMTKDQSIDKDTRDAAEATIKSIIDIVKNLENLGYPLDSITMQLTSEEDGGVLLFFSCHGVEIPEDMPYDLFIKELDKQNLEDSEGGE